MDNIGLILSIIFIVFGLYSIIRLPFLRIKFNTLKKQHETLEFFVSETREKNNRMSSELDEARTVSRQYKEDAERFENEAKMLGKYQGIANIDAEIQRKKQEFLAQRKAAIEKTNQQIARAQEEIKNRMAQVEELREKTENERQGIIDKAEAEARHIAASALDALNREQQLKAAARAMENTISGYDDQYLIPASTLLDELAAQYDFKEAGQELKKARERIRMMVKTQVAATCEYTEPKRRETAIRFVLDAFNGKVDTIMAKVKHDNYGILKQQIIDAYSIVNNNGHAFREARIAPEYLDAIQNELKWAVATHELLMRDREEQRRIKEEMREEERAQREYERALKEAEKEEKIIQDAMKKVRQEMAVASAERREAYEAKLREMEEKLRVAEEKNQRAISMAQQTKSGHVYVISNIGSFGEDVLKIGMTRRLEPMERVRELGDASVPFPFDVHAFIFSEDAPSLENNLHKIFSDNQVNKINPRKEFFRANLGRVRAEIERSGFNASWTMRAEALEYRESVAIGAKQQHLEVA